MRGKRRERDNHAISEAVQTRRATSADLDALLADVQAGFDSYATFASAGWHAPYVSVDRDRTRERLTDIQTWALLACASGKPIGHVSFCEARSRSLSDREAPDPEREPIANLAHLWQLFVMPAWWGRGVAPVLHDAAVEEMRVRGYVRARLYTPSLHARARRFYERRGWIEANEEFSERLTLTLAEYRLAL